jgi:hypothetical protein
MKRLLVAERLSTPSQHRRYTPAVWPPDTRGMHSLELYRSLLRTGRSTVERLMTVEHYAARFVSLIEQVAGTEAATKCLCDGGVAGALAS